jgi:hypothetical protein
MKRWQSSFAMQRTQHFRLLVLLSVSFVCVALNFWLVKTGHYRLPLFVFVGAVALIALAFRKLPPPTRDPREIEDGLLRASASARRLGFLYIFGFAMAIVGLFTGEFKNFPIWGIVLLFLWGGFLIWAAFRGAKCFKTKGKLSKENRREEAK